MKSAEKVVLALNNVSKSFAKTDSDEVTNALSSISVEMTSGEFVCIVGPSGCGKSTILRLVAGLIMPTTGTVKVDGSQITAPSPERGMVFQKPTLFPWLTVRQNIAFSARMQEKNKDAEIERMLEVIGLKSFELDYPHQLSGGMAQRVALARTLINEPYILLLDEPLGALDAFTRMSMQDEILKIWKETRQLAVMVTHDIEEAVYMGTRVIVMEPSPGRIIDDIAIKLPYPRNRASDQFNGYRNTILEKLHLGSCGAV